VGIGEGPPALRTVPRSVKLLSAPVLGDAISAEVVLAAKADGVLVDTEADGTEELVLQAASHLQRLRGIYRGNAPGLSVLGLIFRRAVYCLWDLREKLTRSSGIFTFILSVEIWHKKKEKGSLMLNDSPSTEADVFITNK